MAGSGGMGKAGMGGAGGKAGAGGKGGAGGMITCPTADTLPNVWGDIICAKNADCCPTSDTATCTTRARAGINNLYPALPASVTANTAEINCDDFIACMTAINNASCMDWPKEIGSDNFGIPVNEPKCRTFIRGRVTSGTGTAGPTANCSQDYQCNNGHCDDPDGPTTAQALQCITFKGTGQNCLATPDEVGEANLACNPTTHFCQGSSGNTQGICIARFENGANCTGPAECQSRQCASTTAASQCVKPLTCEYIPQPPPSTCSVANVGSQKSSLGWLAVGAAALAFAGTRRRRRQ
jgi:MYXO-CTERM domain-containing protein